MKSLFDVMSGIVEKYMQDYKVDFYSTDKQSIMDREGGKELLWIVRQSGTELLNYHQSQIRGTTDHLLADYWICNAVKAYKITVLKTDESEAYGDIEEVDITYIKDMVRNAKTGINSEGFKDWYSGSTSTDETGAPMIVFHVSKSTNRQIEAFRRKWLGTNSKDLLSYIGFHFTPSFEMAERVMSGNNGSVTKAYLHIKNPLVITESQLVKDMLAYGYKKGFVDTRKVNLEKLYALPYFSSFGASIANELAIEANRSSGKVLVEFKKLSESYLSHLMSKGYDGIKYLNEIEWHWEKRYDFIAFEPWQVLTFIDGELLQENDVESA